MLPQTFQFSSLARRTIQAQFSGGHITTDAGLLLLREVDRKTQLSATLAKRLTDDRQLGKVRHELHAMLQQRLFAYAAGYEDLNDHRELRNDFAHQAAVGRLEPLASISTLHRFEAAMDRQAIIESHRLLWEQFIASYRKPPKQIVLDFDATDIPLHGDQPEKFFHGYYDHYCYLPLYAFCGRFPLVAYLRQSQIDGAKHTGAILKLLVTYIRQHWPDVKILFRGDSGFCRQLILNWCDRNGVDYLVGIARNKRLEAMFKPIMAYAEQRHRERRLDESGATKCFWRYSYQAGSWKNSRQVIGKMEVTDKGRNPRFVVTTLTGNDRQIYCEQYCARGDMENRIKDQQLDLFAKRTSCRSWWSNQWRLMLSMLAFVLFEKLREGLSHPKYRKLSVSSLRLKFIKIAAVVTRNTRRIRFLMNENHPDQAEFIRLSQVFSPG